MISMYVNINKRDTFQKGGSASHKILVFQKVKLFLHSFNDFMAPKS